MSPPGYRPARPAHPDVRLVEEEIDRFVVRLDPGPVVDAAGGRVAELVRAHAAALRTRFYGPSGMHAVPQDCREALQGFRAPGNWREDAVATAPGVVFPGSAGIGVAALHADLLSWPAREALVDAGLAVPTRGGEHGVEHDWVTMPEPLVALLSSLVAEGLAQSNSTSLVTDQTTEFRVAAGAGADDLAALLLAAPPPRQEPGPDTVAGLIRLLTVRVPVPVDLANVPMATIVEIRRRHEEDFLAFSAAVEQTVRDLNERVTPETDRALVEAYLNDELVARFKAPQNRLKKQLRGSGLDAGLTTMAVQVPAPLATAAAMANGAGGAAAAAAGFGLSVAGFGVAAIGWYVGNRRRRDSILQPSPASYLVHVPTVRPRCPRGYT